MHDAQPGSVAPDLFVASALVKAQARHTVLRSLEIRLTAQETRRRMAERRVGPIPHRALSPTGSAEIVDLAQERAARSERRAHCASPTP